MQVYNLIVTADSYEYIIIRTNLIAIGLEKPYKPQNWPELLPIQLKYSK